MSREYGRNENVKNERIMIRISKKGLKKLKEFADMQDLSLSDYIRKQLCVDEESLEEDEDFYE